MLNFILSLFVSVLIGIGLSILLVEKGKDWPIRPIRIKIQVILRKFYWILVQMLFCTTCTSFWATLVGDIVVGAISYSLGFFYFFWPFSGFITAGIVWIIIEYLNSIDKDQNINVFIDKGDLE